MLDKHTIEKTLTINKFTVTTYIPVQTQEENKKVKKSILLALYNIFSNGDKDIDTKVKKVL